jgi:cyclohexanone monooxygenase
MADDAMVIDQAAIRARYDHERDIRMRAEGNDQYVEVAGQFAHYLDDPWADPNFSRDPVTENVEVLIVGGGFGGLLNAAQLRQAGIHDFRIIEKAADFGGTWYWNRYPGAACDTESYIYMPLLEETGYMPKAKYAKAEELFEHSKRIGRHFNLYPQALFQTIITEARWDEAAARWRVKTDRGDEIAAHYLILAGGLLHVPKLPGIPGIETFKGHSFHTTRWDYDYTGGDPNGAPLENLKDKRVGIIGTGATAVQCIPHLGAAAGHLYVFQRTPSSVDVRDDRPTDPAWAAGLKPGWHRERMDNFTTVISGGDFEVDLVNDGWTDLIGNILLVARRKAKAGEPVDDAEALIQLADYQKMERVRARVDAIVKDKATAEALKPWYDQFCKRPCFHDEYLPTFNRPNVTLVDTHGRGVERITERGVVVDGQEFELDCLIYATGFEIASDYTQRIGFEVYGRDGLTLTEKWKNGVETYHGLFSRGFPNLFIVSTAQSGQSANFQHMLDVQSRHIAWILGEAEKRRVRTLEAEATAEAEWVETIVALARGRVSFLTQCTPGYYNNEGQLSLRTFKNNQYWRGPVVFIRMLDRWRADGSMPGLELTYQ